jgi:hypothetical protein
MLMTDSYGIVPGLTTSRETYEAEFRWGSQFQGVFANGLIDGSAVDSGNSPTYELRPGLLLGQVLSTAKYKQYSPTATDGSEVAAAVLVEALRMQDFSGNAVDRFYAVLVGGPVQASKLIGLDNMARQQMDKFIFDDIGNICGHHWFPWKRFQTKTANYTVVAADNYTLFDNVGAGAAITFTLPALAAGYYFGFRVEAGQNVTVASNEGDNLIAFNDASADSVAFSTGAQLIGGMVVVYTNPGATKWIVENRSAGTNTITVAT